MIVRTGDKTMRPTRCQPALAAFTRLATASATALVLAVGFVATAASQDARPITFLDQQEMRSFGSETVSPDGRWMLYTITTPDWQQASEQTDIYLVSVEEGVESTRQMTFTEEHDERAPAWSRDGSFFVFVSDRGDRRQLYLMRPGGGEARRITQAKRTASPTSNSAGTGSGWCSARANPASSSSTGSPWMILRREHSPDAEQITHHAAGVENWAIAPDSRRIYFIRPDSVDTDEELRWEQDFTVDIYHLETPLQSLWALDMDRLGRRRGSPAIPSYSVTGFTISDDSRWVGYRGTRNERYKRMIWQSNLHTELYLLEAASGRIEQLTDVDEIAKSGPYFSPDGRWVAYRAPRDMTQYTRLLTDRVYIRAVDETGGDFRMLGNAYDGNVGLDFWSDDGNTIYFNDGVRTSRQLMALDVASGTVTQLTDEPSPLRVSGTTTPG
jgi:Tol biopolymer transport system component